MRSLVGVSLFLAAAHHPPASFCEEEGEGGSNDCDREGGGGKDFVLSIIARTRSSTSLRSSASLVRIRSASRRLRSRSLSASASSSASVGIVLGDRGAMLLIRVRAKLAAIWDTEDEGEGERVIHSARSSSSPLPAESGSIPVNVLGTNPLRRGEGGRPVLEG